MYSYFSDLGNGVFDGANLVMNMERLNMNANKWARYYNVFSKVDTEENVIWIMKNGLADIIE